MILETTDTSLLLWFVYFVAYLTTLASYGGLRLFCLVFGGEDFEKLEQCETKVNFHVMVGASKKGIVIR